MIKNEVASGKMLLAEPFMVDPNFKRSAVLLCEHGQEGSLGFILNKKLDTQVDELIDDFPEFKAEVFFGGPVQTDTIHFIHCFGDLLDGSIQVSDGLYLGGDFDQLKFLITSQLIEPRDIRFFLGYSGWSEGQLTEEMNYGSWVVADMDVNYLFKLAPENIWQKAMYNKGDAYTVISELPENMGWN